MTGATEIPGGSCFPVAAAVLSVGTWSPEPRERLAPVTVIACDLAADGAHLLCAHQEWVPAAPAAGPRLLQWRWAERKRGTQPAPRPCWGGGHGPHTSSGGSRAPRAAGMLTDLVIGAQLRIQVMKGPD